MLQVNISSAIPAHTVRSVLVCHIWQTHTFLTKVWGAVMKHNACPQCFVKAVTCGMSEVCYIFVLLVTFVLIFTQISVAFQLNVWFMSGLHIHVIKETGYIVTCMWMSLWRVGKDTGYVLGRNWCSQPQMLQFRSWEFMVQTFILINEFKIKFRWLVNRLSK